MANTYTQLYVQFVFAVKGRQNLIPAERKNELHKYITGIVQKRTHKMLAINCMPDHIHIFVGLKPSQSISDLVRDVKSNSSIYITDKKFVRGKFNWQDGFGAFSYSHSHIDAVIKYHRKKSFKDEYLDFLKKFNVEYDDKYLFDSIE
jgi:REP element-mobilizing transposase RayT